MEEMLKKEEVMHVAKLARIEIDEQEMENYQIKLKKILSEIEKINNINIDEGNILICPTENSCELRDDISGEMLNPKEVLINAPRKAGNYIAVPVVINE